MGKIRDRLSAITFAAAKNSGGGGSSSNYNDLTHRPKINGNVLEGDMSTSDLEIPTASMSVSGETLIFNNGTN